MINIDGSIMEGGGSIVRNAVALSAITQKPISIKNIRANRSKPGLRNQHTYVVKSIAQLSQAKTEGAQVGSKELSFLPGEIKGGEFEVDVKTAGSISLLLQALLPVACRASERVKLFLIGGTDVPMAPPIDYMRYVFLPMLKKLGVETTLCIGRRGHYPKGGGRLSCDVEPLLRSKPIQYQFDDPLEISCICGRAHAVRLPCHIPERMIDAAIDIIEPKGFTIGAMESECPEPKYDAHLGPGTGITLWACTNHGTILSGDALGKKGVPAEAVGKNAAKNLLEQLKTKRPIDYHLADQLILWMAVSPFPSIIDTTKITLHTLTNIEIAKLITDAEFTISAKQGQPGIISCEPKLILEK